jgi:hypothetical protein
MVRNGADENFISSKVSPPIGLALNASFASGGSAFASDASAWGMAPKW